MVQNLEGTPAFIHDGPFANIAHDCNLIMATNMVMRLNDYVITEADFSADLGAKKFFDIKYRLAGFKPDASVIVSCRVLNHGRVTKENLTEENLVVIEKKIPNLFQHVNNIQNEYYLPCIISINVFPTDSPAEVKLLQDLCAKKRH